MDFDAVAQRQIRVMWVGGVWILAAFMPLFLVPWHWTPRNAVALLLLLAGAYAAYRGHRATAALGRIWRYLFVAVPVALVIAGTALAAWLAVLGVQA